MDNTQLLKAGRDGLLGLHKALVDFERWKHETVHGSVTPGQFLNLLLEDAELAWLRKFSTLIVEIDEMFAQRDGIADESVLLHLKKLRDLVTMEEQDEDFVKRYQTALQQDSDSATRQAELRLLLFERLKDKDEGGN